MTNQSNALPREALYKNALFDVEHALDMYAFDYCTIPAEGIYDNEALRPLMSVIESCHIYLIGYTPIINLVDVQQKNDKLYLEFTVGEKEHAVTYDLPKGWLLKQEGDLHYLENTSGKRYEPNPHDMQARLSSETESINFEVKYIGQAYGQDGSRNAVDRLLKHETLQKIALKGVPKGRRLTLLMLSIQPNNQLVTVFNPFAKNKDEGSTRITSGLEKLFNTTEEERISLYEAALIRYFYPEFNKEFKDSFPSTKLKILQDCYEKDFSTVIAEICIDGLPFRLCSEKVSPTLDHIAKHDLHKDEARRMFFGL